MVDDVPADDAPVDDVDEDGNPDLPRQRRRGRKRVPLDIARRHQVACRLTDAELARVDAARGGVPRGEYLRLAALRRPPRVVPELNRTAWAELARLSGNLNQAMRAVHAGHMATPPVDLAALRQAVEDVRLALLGGAPDRDEIPPEEATP